MQEKLSLKNILITIVLMTILFSVSLFTYNKYSSSESSIAYTGLGQSSDQNEYVVKRDIVVTSAILNSDKIEFVQRKITGGGVNPGWVISLLETQPNVFTGRVIVDDGVYQHPVTVKEEVTNIFVGEMKSKDGKKETFSMKKSLQNCKDEEKNLFEYSLTGTYGATQFLGCGGNILSEGI